VQIEIIWRCPAVEAIRLIIFHSIITWTWSII